MIQRSSRASFLGSSQNNSQLSLYSHASSGSAENSSYYDRAERTRLAKGTHSGQGTRSSISGQGYLTTRRTAPVSKAVQSKVTTTASAFPARREKPDEQTSGTAEGINGAGDDLGSYLSSFGRSSKVGGKDRELPRGSELDWAKLIESEQSHDTRLEHDFSDDDQGDHNANTFLKKSLRPGIADSPQKTSNQVHHHERTKRLSPEIKYDIVDENSSPNVSDIVMTDSLNSSNTHDPVVTSHPKQAHRRTVLGASDHSVVDGNPLKDVKVASDLLSASDIDVSHSPDKPQPVAVRNKLLSRSDRSVTMSEEQPLSDSFENIISSIDQLEACVDDTHQHSETSSSFGQNLHDVHSLRELEELEEPATCSHGAKSSIQSKSVSTKVSTSAEQKQPPVSLSPLQRKSRSSGFKFSATTTTNLDHTLINNHYDHKTVSYGSDEFESEPVSEVESVDSSAEEVIEEGSVAIHHGNKSETAASDHGAVELQGSGGGTDVENEEHSELSYSSFSEAEQRNKSGKS